MNWDKLAPYLVYPLIFICDLQASKRTMFNLIDTFFSSRRKCGLLPVVMHGVLNREQDPADIEVRGLGFNLKDPIEDVLLPENQFTNT